MIPAVVSAPGSVVSTSTKPDVLTTTSSSRRCAGPCYLYDPSGTVEAPRGVERVHWSPVPGCRGWDEALVIAHNLVHSVRRPDSGTAVAGGDDHWTERAQALLAPVLHAAALDGADMAAVLRWVDRHEASPALAILDREGAASAGDLLAGIAATDPREQSGIWSTASGVLSAYRSDAALTTTQGPTFDTSRFCTEDATLYVCTTGRRQRSLAPLVVGILSDVRSAAYDAAARQLLSGSRSSTGPAVGHDQRAPGVPNVSHVPGVTYVSTGHAPGGPGPPPVLFALDEVANIAPIPDLPSMVSEGGGQGVLTLACLQDLSQARERWGRAADGFLSLFGTTVVLPGIGDIGTLEALSALAGEEDAPDRSISVAAAAGGSRTSALLGRIVLGRRGSGRDDARMTMSTRRRRRLPVDVVSRGRPGAALAVGQHKRMGWVRLTPWFAGEPWQSILTAGRDGPLPAASRDGPLSAGRDGPLPAGRVGPLAGPELRRGGDEARGPDLGR